MSRTADDIIKNYPPDKENLISILQDLQQAFGYISETDLVKLSRYLKQPSATIYGTASFYSEFRFSPPGKNEICLCQGSSCHLNGGEELQKTLERHLGIKAGEVSRSGEYSLNVSDCMGACHHSPVARVNDRYHTQLKPETIIEIIKQTTNEDEG